jgi:hypothetical protein
LRLIARELFGTLRTEVTLSSLSRWLRNRLKASYLTYMDVFWVLMLLALLAVPLALSLRKVKLGSAPAAVH